MTFPKGQPPRWVPGQYLHARDLNAVGDYARRIGEPPASVRPVAAALTVALAEVQSVTVVGEINAVWPGGTGAPFTVYMPPEWSETSRTQYDGTTNYAYLTPQNRTATRGPDAQVEVLTPELVAGDLIMVVWLTAGWQLVNNARVWAHDPNLL